jgi:hypothetical protein
MQVLGYIEYIKKGKLLEQGKPTKVEKNLSSL